MKKKFLLFTAIAGMMYVTFSSYTSGPALTGFACTGAETDNSNPTGCSATGGSCHGTVGGSSATILVAIELDSAGSAINHYVGGKTYTVKITGTNNSTGVALPKFGLQMTAIKGSVSLSSPTTSSNAGTWSTTVPSNTRYVAGPTSFITLNYVEHSAPLTPTTGTGLAGSTIVESFSWTAPAAGTGTISFWGAVNAVNNDGNASAVDLWNTNHIVIKEWSPTMLSVTNESANISIQAFPNPVANTLNLQMDNVQTGAYSVKVFGLDARCVASETIEVTGTSQTAAINTAKWLPGTYMVAVEKDGVRKVVHVVKQ
jgi:hypothetical protein